MDVEFRPSHVPIIQRKDYTYETLRAATNNFRSPAIVRGLFLDTPAVKTWATPGVLSSKIGKFVLPVVKDTKYGTLQNERYLQTFEDAYDNEILADTNNRNYLFFPVRSRFNFNGSDAGSAEKLEQAVNELVQQDLQLDQLIWPGFGTKRHKTYLGGQFVIGRGTNDSSDTTGTGWHCAAGNNWFAQVSLRTYITLLSTGTVFRASTVLPCRNK